MFNLQGSELIIILLLALVVLGPEKLPDAMRKLGEFYGQMKKMSSSFQQEFKAAVDEPMREVRDTANMLRDSADFRKLSAGERAEKPKTAEMATPAADTAAGSAAGAAPTPSTPPVTVDPPPDIPAPKPPAGPVVTGTPPVPGTSSAPPPPPPPPANGSASPSHGALPPLASSEVDAE